MCLLEAELGFALVLDGCDAGGAFGCLVGEERFVHLGGSLLGECGRHCVSYVVGRDMLCRCEYPKLYMSFIPGSHKCSGLF